MVQQLFRLGSALAITVLASAQAFAQTAPPAPQPPPQQSRLWITGGGGFTTLKGDCTTCTGEPVYSKASHLLVNIGFRGNDRVDAGVEVGWVPSSTRTGDAIRSTFVMGVGQYRPAKTWGLFLKGGMGIAFVRNWIYDATNDITPPFTTNAMSLMYGAGWEFRTRSRVGLQVYGLHHVVALGDLNVTGGSNVENVVGNYWSFGGSVVIR